MTYIDIVKGYAQIECVKKGNKYHYYIKDGDDAPFEFQSLKSPTELSKSTEIGRTIIKRFDNLPKNQFDNLDIDKEFRNILSRLEADLKHQQKELEREANARMDSLEEEYIEYYTLFETKRKRLGLTPLQFIIRVFEGCGVGAEIEMFKALCGYLQTFMGLKGTNVIGVGSQSSGKTHCIEKPLICIPEEFVHKGTFTRASFFSLYDGKDLTGHIFYLGDLGGQYDDNNTIESRDILKQLSTDGYISRSLVDEEDGTKKQEVFGYPSIVYTTVSEDMINEQERSRSLILTPPEVDQCKLMLFDSFMEAPGEQYELKDEIVEDMNCIKGFVWWLGKNIKHVELFNPFMFCVRRYLSNMQDFNRKIKEFNMLLKITCILNESYSVDHTIYCDFECEDDDEFEVTTTLYLPSKQDVIDALTLFEGSTGLLPSEISLTKAILKKYDEYPEMDLDLEKIYLLDENSTYEDLVTYHATISNEGAVQTSTDDGGNSYISDYSTAMIDENGAECYCFFTIDDLRKGNANQKWYRDVKDDLSNKLHKLHNFGILISIGKTSAGRNVYGIAEDVDGKVNNINPVFGKEDIDNAMITFHKVYPSLSDKFDKYVNKQKQLRIKHTNFEIKDKHLYELLWNIIRV